jgi:hypothetical protein
MKRLKCVFALTLAGATVAMAQSGSPPAADAGQPAPSPDPAASSPLRGIKLSGLADGYYSMNFNHPASGTNLYRNFDVKGNQFSLNMAKLTLEHDVDPVGFKIDILNWVPQAFVSYKPGKLNGTQFDFGKFYTSAGAELTETHLNWNYSRALLYANGPYYHFGLRVTQPLSTNFGVGFQLVNGWNNVEDNNSGKTMGFTTALTTSRVSPNEKTSFYMNFDYGTEKLAGGGSNDWIGVAGAARFSISRNWSISPRLEYYYDKDGFISGTAQKLKEFTLTGEYKWTEGLLSRLEYRRDWSNQPVFERGTGGVYKNQDTLLFGIVAFFAPGR